MSNKKWYSVPPYSNEGWQILNQDGELVATFEKREDCEYVCKMYNTKVVDLTDKDDPTKIYKYMAKARTLSDSPETLLGSLI